MGEKLFCKKQSLDEKPGHNLMCMTAINPVLAVSDANLDVCYLMQTNNMNPHEKQ